MMSFPKSSQVVFAMVVVVLSEGLISVAFMCTKCCLQVDMSRNNDHVLPIASPVAIAIDSVDSGSQGLQDVPSTPSLNRAADGYGGSLEKINTFAQLNMNKDDVTVFDLKSRAAVIQKRHKALCGALDAFGVFRINVHRFD